MSRAPSTATAHLEHPRVAAPGRRAARRGGWRSRQRAVTVGLDALAALAAGALAHLLRFGTDQAWLRIAGRTIDYRFLPFALAVAWLLVLALDRAYDDDAIGSPVDSERRAVRAGLHLLAVLALVIYVAGITPPRGYVLVVVPLVVGLTTGSRLLLQLRLQSRRRAGLDLDDVVLVGSGPAASDFVTHLQRERSPMHRAVGRLTIDAADRRASSELPVLGSVLDAADVVREVDAALVVVVDGVEGTDLQELAWRLGEIGCELGVVPPASAIAGPNLNVRRASDLPMLQLSNPHLSRGARISKGLIDRVGAALAVLVLSPLLLTIALAIRLGSPGPALFHQERFGLGGVRFRMTKFRTMVDGAEALQDEEMDEDSRDGTIFKRKDDPRITRVGRVLRRFSLDELPQLLNVLRGEMSLVGPRPRPVVDIELHLAANGELDRREERRMLVKPGMTGLWQVSGRSDLPFEEAIRLDMFYIDHWSPRLDLLIMWRTVAAVLAGRGAY